jgi:hypothetical protein
MKKDLHDWCGPTDWFNFMEKRVSRVKPACLFLDLTAASSAIYPTHACMLVLCILHALSQTTTQVRPQVRTVAQYLAVRTMYCVHLTQPAQTEYSEKERNSRMWKHWAAPVQFPICCYRRSESVVNILK